MSRGGRRTPPGGPDEAPVPSDAPVLRLPHLLLLVAYACALALAYDRIGPGGYGDVDRYRQLALDWRTDVGSPWRFRLLTPFLAGLLSRLLQFDLTSAFRILNITFLTLSVFCFHEFLRRVGFDPLRRFLGVSFYVFSYGFTANVTAGAWVDPGLYLTGTGTLLVLATLRNHELPVRTAGLLSLIFLVGVLNKETALFFLGAVYLVLEDGTIRGRLRALSLTSLIGLPALVAFAGLRLLIAPAGEAYLDHYSSTQFQAIVRYWLGGPALGVYYCFGFLWPLLLLGRRRWSPFARRIAPLLLLLFPLNLLASDVARTMSAGLPIAILAALAAVSPSISWRWIVPMLALYWGASALPEFLDPGLPRKLARALLSLAGLGVVALLLLRGHAGAAFHRGPSTPLDPSGAEPSL